ncbi:AraC family transcriptional regulator [Butyrivibrio fibrisolvens]|uniref:AraC family transcriptional regulator n=1 Tax=Butyrivibrio fibrisolvens TaxID=831 RepID=UPI0003B5F1DE|nr:AraC family transcriptional regulator [Butyrivibrio fibrisolvens]
MIYFDYPIIGFEKELPLYLLNMGLHECQGYVEREEGFSSPQILFCTKGSGTLIVGGRRYRILAHMAIFLPENVPHKYYPNEDVWDIHWVVPGGSALPALLQHFQMTEPAVYKLAKTTRLETIFRSMHEALHSGDIMGNYRCAGYLYEFLLEFYRLITLKESGNYYSPALHKALDYINQHYLENVTMEDLCGVSNVSKQHLCHLFRKSLHMRPMEYITRKRLQTAKEMLSTTDYSIEKIAEDTGFCTASYFCKNFKRLEEITAGEFRKNNT